MIRINLLPERRRRRRLVPESGVVSAVLLVLAALVGSYLYGDWQNHLVRVQTDEINREITAIRPKVAEVLALQRQIEELRAREDLLRSLEARELPWSEMLVDLAQRTPRDAWLANAAISGAAGPTRLAVNGGALSYNSVARFMTSLAGSRFYSDVDLQTATSGTIGPAQVIQFGLITTIRPGVSAASEGAR